MVLTRLTKMSDRIICFLVLVLMRMWKGGKTNRVKKVAKKAGKRRTHDTCASWFWDSNPQSSSPGTRTRNILVPGSGLEPAIFLGCELRGRVPVGSSFRYTFVKELFTFLLTYSRTSSIWAYLFIRFHLFSFFCKKSTTGYVSTGVLKRLKS